MLQLDLLIVVPARRRSRVRGRRAHHPRAARVGRAAAALVAAGALLVAALAPAGLLSGARIEGAQLGGRLSDVVDRRSTVCRRRWCCSPLFIGLAAVIVVVGRRGSSRRVLRAASGAPGGRHGGLPRRQPHPVLRRVGVGARPDVLPHRRVGLVEPPARRDQVPALHVRCRSDHAHRRHPRNRREWRKREHRSDLRRSGADVARRRSSSGCFTDRASSSRSRPCRCTRGCPTRTPRRRPRARSCSPACCSRWAATACCASPMPFAPSAFGQARGSL